MGAGELAVIGTIVPVVRVWAKAGGKIRPIIPQAAHSLASSMSFMMTCFSLDGSADVKIRLFLGKDVCVMRRRGLGTRPVSTASEICS